MNRFVLAALAILCLAGGASPAPGQDRPVSDFPTVTPVKADPPPDDGTSPAILLQLLVAEFRGTVPRDMLPSDLPWSPLRPLSSEDKRSASELIGERLQALTEHGRVDMLSRPQIRTLAGQHSLVEIGGGLSVSYLVRTGERTFEQKELQCTPPLGIRMDLTPHPVPGEARKIEIRPLNVSITTLDGRQPIEGLALDFGKPIISTRSLQSSSLMLVQGEPAAVVLPGPPGRHALMFITARIVPASLPVQPGEAFSDPVARERAIRQRGLATPQSSVVPATEASKQR
jgi:hypothetical protein